MDKINFLRTRSEKMRNTICVRRQQTMSAQERLNNMEEFISADLGDDRERIRAGKRLLISLELGIIRTIEASVAEIENILDKIPRDIVKYSIIKEKDGHEIKKTDYHQTIATNIKTPLSSKMLRMKDKFLKMMQRPLSFLKKSGQNTREDIQKAIEVDEFIASINEYDEKIHSWKIDCIHSHNDQDVGFTKRQLDRIIEKFLDIPVKVRDYPNSSDVVTKFKKEFLDFYENLINDIKEVVPEHKTMGINLKTIKWEG